MDRNLFFLLMSTIFISASIHSFASFSKEEGYPSKTLGEEVRKVFEEKEDIIYSDDVRRKSRNERSASPSQTKICQHPCTNGYCYDGSCICYKGFGGDNCEVQLDHCSQNPRLPPFSTLQTDSYTAKITCTSGYHIKEGIYHYDLLCKDNEWYKGNVSETLVPKCRSYCDPKCQNGGTCLIFNKCSCPPGFTGPYCEEEYCIESQPSVDEIFSGANANSLCPVNYVFVKNASKIEIACEGKNWVYNFTQLLCNPVCKPPCHNEGLCVSPNKCQCKGYFKGKSCSQIKCQDGPRNLPHTIINRLNSNTALLTCEKGYRLMTGDSKVISSCKNGKWMVLPPLPREPRYLCYPVCSTPCVNGGRCIAPNVCKCPEGFTGVHCEKRYMLSVVGKRCAFPFRHRGKTYLSCTGADHTKPWCATETDLDGNVVSWEMCYAHIGWSQLMETEKGIPCKVPFTEGEVTYYSSIYREGSKECPLMPVEGPISSQTNQSTSWARSLPQSQSKSEEDVIILSDGSECREVSNNSRKSLSNYEHCLTGDGVEKSFCDSRRESSGGRVFCMQDFGWKTYSYAENGKNCVFPSVLMKKKVHRCVSYKGELPWCATEVDSQGNPTEFSNCIPRISYASLSSSQLELVLAKTDDRRRKAMTLLETVSGRGRQCVFPFVLEGETHYRCTRHEAGVPWCPTKVNDEMEPLDSDICLPNLEYYLKELHYIQQSYRGMETRKSMENAIGEAENLNKLTFYDYIMRMGWQKFYLMILGEKVYASPPHEKLILRYPKTDEAFRNLIEKKNIQTENELKSRGVAEILGLFGRHATSDANHQIKIDFIRNVLDSQIKKYFSKTKMEVEDNLYTSYSIVLKEFQFDSLTKSEFFPDMPLYGFQNSSSYQHSDIEHFLPTSVTKEVCLSFIYEGQWYGNGACIKRENSSSLECAVVTNQHFEPLIFSECVVKEESKGEFISLIPKYKFLEGRSLILTKRGDRCVMPFKFKNENYDECLEDSTTKFGLCPTTDQHKHNISQMDHCHPLAETLIKLRNDSNTTKELDEEDDFLEEDLSSPTPSFLSMDSILEETPAEDKTLNKIRYPRMKTVFGNSCIFPFIHEGKTFHSCTNYNSKTKWCAVQVNPGGEVQKRERCASKSKSNGSKPSLRVYSPVMTYDGSMCIFPFRYKGITYEKCTNVDDGYFWCPTKVNRERVPMYGGYCQEETPKKIDHALKASRKGNVGRFEVVFTLDGHKCVFPTKFKGKRFQGCIQFYHDRPWCRINKGDPSRRVWATGECRLRPRKIYHKTETGKKKIMADCGKECKFPFKYNGNEYNDCVESDDHETLWCATEVDEHRNIVSKGVCNIRRSTPPTPLVKTTVFGKSCKFPFRYEERELWDCTSAGEKLHHWCPTELAENGAVLSSGICLPEHIYMQV